MIKFNWKLFRKLNKIVLSKSIYFLLIFVIIWQFCFPRVSSHAQTLSEEILAIADQIEEIEVNTSVIPNLGTPRRIVIVPVTAYNSLAGQTDSTPCITANGFDLCKNDTQNVIAANFLPFGTKIRFPDYDPDTIYTVQDRMNARYAYRADIWMKTKGEAKIFGIKRLKMEIYTK